jgi:hypothetical protein
VLPAHAGQPGASSMAGQIAACCSLHAAPALLASLVQPEQQALVVATAMQAPHLPAKPRPERKAKCNRYSLGSVNGLYYSCTALGLLSVVGECH